MILFEKTDHQ